MFKTVLKILISVPILVLFVSVFIIYVRFNQQLTGDKNVIETQNELIFSNTTVQVLTKTGQLSHLGWSRSQLPFEINPSNIHTSTSVISLLDPLRFKKWEFYFFSSKDFSFGFAIFDVRLVKGSFIHYSNMTDPNEVIKKLTHMNILESVYISDNCKVNCLAANYKNKHVDGVRSFKSFKHTPNNHDLKLKANGSGVDIELDVNLQTPGLDADYFTSLMPMSEDSTLFFYGTKINIMRPKGKIVINGLQQNIEDFLVVHDTARSVFPLRSGWIWTSGNGYAVDSNNVRKLIGINLGHGIHNSKTAKHTEDIFYIEGKAFKLPAVKIEIPDAMKDRTSDNNKEYFISFKNEDQKRGNRCDLTYVSKRKVLMESKFLMIFDVSFIVSYGYFTGTCTTDAEEVYTLENINGVFEFQNALW